MELRHGKQIQAFYKWRKKKLKESSALSIEEESLDLDIDSIRDDARDCVADTVGESEELWKLL